MPAEGECSDKGEAQHGPDHEQENVDHVGDPLSARDHQSAGPGRQGVAVRGGAGADHRTEPLAVIAVQHNVSYLHPHPSRRGPILALGIDAALPGRGSG